MLSRKPAYKPQERVSKSRALNASILTVLTLLLVVMWAYHTVWAVKVMINRPYGSFLNNLIFGPGTLIANTGVSTKIVSYINTKLVEDKIDSDHKKYI
ncbi:uncharacterized protein CANTADRAFT_90730 [Suhomyces tanzawaensis NRRL Y-17324]|uniref:Uncharacterized protein n=1 Tax=Suhomyces tanzawaensis NRRL Y-17324 TaxID=984487 RepID=A0A1E4SFY5_9ASCO|nr:uncharacterized protein CANTADRAFT_90730 [Suhomyces tanzawaensis NRRL Y-17324]ODV78380.1 hypothetical protein CANTADRAFT_90730 [Suhomyces tanzawaensis NRRL Y-17324]